MQFGRGRVGLSFLFFSLLLHLFGGTDGAALNFSCCFFEDSKRCQERPEFGRWVGVFSKAGFLDTEDVNPQGCEHFQGSDGGGAEVACIVGAKCDRSQWVEGGVERMLLLFALQWALAGRHLEAFQDGALC